MKNPRFFTLAEFLHSDTAKKRGIDNTPSPIIVNHLNELVTTILDPIRKAWGSGLIVSSGYRCPALNKAVGGVKTSAHQYGYAADIVPANGKLKQFIDFAEKYLKENDIPFDQSIEEHVKGSHWWHIAVRNANGLQRRKYLTINK